MELYIIIVFCCIFLVLAYYIYYIYGLIVLIRSLNTERQQLYVQIATMQSEKERNVKIQRAVIKGQLAEQLYPASDDCPYMPSDMRFIGNPIDYIIFDGYTSTKDGDGVIKEIIFAEIKSGSAQLSAHQRAIRDAISEGRVKWSTIRVDRTSG